MQDPARLKIPREENTKGKKERGDKRGRKPNQAIEMK
jgi:hypothetical protein